MAFRKVDRDMAARESPIPVNPSTMVYWTARGITPRVYTLMASTVTFT